MLQEWFLYVVTRRQNYGNKTTLHMESRNIEHNSKEIACDKLATLVNPKQCNKGEASKAMVYYQLRSFQCHKSWDQGLFYSSCMQWKIRQLVQKIYRHVTEMLLFLYTMLWHSNNPYKLWSTSHQENMPSQFLTIKAVSWSDWTSIRILIVSSSGLIYQ